MQMTYPNGCTHALAMSYDDGQAFDRRLAALFDKYGIKGTFHLNAGKLGQDGYVGADELPELYRNHEVSCHTYTHPRLTHLDTSGITDEVNKDRAALEAIMGHPVTGMSYPYGEYDARVIDVLSGLGIVYSRTVNEDAAFAPPGDFMQWRPTCHHNNGLIGRFREFIDTPPQPDAMPLMCVWGHSYEFDRDDNWALIESFCKEASGKPYIWYATMIEIYQYMKALAQ